MIENTLGVLHNIVYNEHSRNHPKHGGNHPLPVLWRHFLWRLFRSHPVAMLLPVMRNGAFCTTTIVRKKRENALPGMRRTYFRSLDWRHFRSRPVIWCHFRSLLITHAQWSGPPSSIPLQC